MYCNYTKPQGVFCNYQGVYERLCCLSVVLELDIVKFLHFFSSGNPNNGVRYEQQWSRSFGGAYRPGGTSFNARRRSDLGGDCSSVDPNWKAQDQHLHHLLSSKKTYGIAHTTYLSFYSFNQLFLRCCRFVEIQHLDLFAMWFFFLYLNFLLIVYSF